ncbi:MAG: hypothetical protein KBT20_05150 [Bacteroidales bacterium]|nr:hypothetical protein [Candidatus Liminaster caballi]
MFNNTFKVLFATLLSSLTLSVADAASFFDARQSAGIYGHKSVADTHQLLGSPRKASGAVTSLECPGYGYLDGIDGQIWYYTQEITRQEELRDFYTSSVISVYDGHHTLKGSVSITVPDSSRVNYIEPYGIVTNKMFDTNSSTQEILVFFHEVTPDYKGKTYVRVYTIGGDMVAEFPGDGMVVSSRINDWTTYQRYVSVHDSAEEPWMTDIDIYRPATWGESSAQHEHTFRLNSLHITYIDAPFFNFVEAGNDSKYVLTYYEKTFCQYDENGESIFDEDSYVPVFTPDNHFIVETYDRNYQLVDSFSVSTDVPSDEYIARMIGIGSFSDLDITSNVFTDDGRLSYILMFEDVKLTTETHFSYIVFDHDGQVIDTLASGMSDVYKLLSPLKGKEDQFLFLDASNEHLYTVDVPSFTTREVPVTVSDMPLSFNFDRYAAPDDPLGYRYVSGINVADVDAQGNVLTVYAHLTSDCKLHHVVRFNVGPLAQTFTPLVNNQSLDPYLFCADDQMEYIFFSKLAYDAEGSRGRNVLFVGNERGQIVRRIDPAEVDEECDIWTAAIVNYATDNAELLVNFYNPETEMNKVDFHSLPFSSFTLGGDGTEANPYLITSVGELNLISRNPSAHYRLACDIEAAGHIASVPEFTGVFDGDGHTIKDLCVSSDNYYGGLFGTTTYAVVRNLKLYAPHGIVNPGNTTFGLISGYSISSEFSDIVVDQMLISSEGRAVATPFGGLVGEAMSETRIVSCLSSNADITLPLGNVIGGIVGEMRTSSVVTASAVTGSHIAGRSEVGGIAGIIGTGCKVTDCYSEVNISGQMSIGAVAGRCGINGNRGVIARCLASGSVVEDLSETHRGFAVIAGYVEPCWAKSDTTVVISSCVSATSFLVSDSYLSEDADLSAVHVIAGYTKANEPKEDPSEVLVEDGLRHNYAYYSASLDCGSYECLSDDHTSADGKLIIDGNVLLDQSFWTGLGYVFGSDAASPWQFASDRLPWLYIMNGDNAPSVLPSVSTHTSEPASDIIYDLSGMRVTNPQHGVFIVNGKKVIKNSNL